MTNWEKNREPFTKMAVAKQPFGVEKKTETIRDCSLLDCGNCIFYDRLLSCQKLRMEWLDKEYKEPEKLKIDWSKVPIDTPILVKDYFDRYAEGEPAHFAGAIGNGHIRAWEDGKTSHTTTKWENWDYAEIAPGIDCSKWYKE